MPEKIVLAYSGGLDTSIIIPWLKENYAYEVIAMVADVGQGDDVEAVVDKAYKTGAAKVVVEDLREEFLTQYVWPALKAGAVYENKYLLGTSLARPVIAKHQVEVALREGATAVSHGCTGKGNDQVRFEMAYQALAPELKVIAPWREWDLKSREDCLDYAEKRGIQVTASREKIHSRDRNLWHLSHEGGELEDAGNAPFESTWQLTKSPQDAPDRPEQVEIGFEKGVPVSVGGQALDPISLVELLNEIAGRNAVGRIDLVENRFVGIKSQRLLRNSRRHAPSHRPRRTRSPLPRPRPAPLQAARRPEVCRTGLFRTVVHPAARSARRFRRTHAAKHDRQRRAFALQGQRERGQPKIRLLALPDRSVVVHHGRRLRSERCGRLHQNSRIALPRPRQDARRKTLEVAQ